MVLTKEAAVLVCPKNDEESLMILYLAQALGLPAVISDQPHGAKLEREPNLLYRVTKANPAAKQVVIVEIPGESEEEQLRVQGFEVVIIDHHRYDDLDRMQPRSSLEQFRALFGLDDAAVERLGFDPITVNAVGLIDRGFIWELKKSGWSPADIERGIAGYRALARALDEEKFLQEEVDAEVAWRGREERDGVIIIRLEDDMMSIREALSFIVAREFPDGPPTLIIFQGARRVYVQDCVRAKVLFDRFGGFTFGQDLCWGLLATVDRPLPTLDEIMKLIV
jgi:hypothetical protein